MWLTIIGECPAEQYPTAQLLVDGITDYWIDDATAMFSIPVWNHFGTDGPRTINHVEGWHKKTERFGGPRAFKHF